VAARASADPRGLACQHSVLPCAPSGALAKNWGTPQGHHQIGVNSRPGPFCRGRAIVTQKAERLSKIVVGARAPLGSTTRTVVCLSESASPFSFPCLNE
jgi:hypothetical protein